MMFRSWEQLPDFMRVPEVRPYFDMLNRRRASIILKRFFDFTMSLLLMLIIWPVILIIAMLIKLDSPGPALFLQERVTAYGRHFKIVKFRTMVNDAEQKGTSVTVRGDARITRIGRILRKTRLDELPQLLNLIKGDMSFVGTRPEVPKYVAQYRPVYYATLLLPAGVTSEASIRYKDEDKLLSEAEDVDHVYVNDVLPAKMVWNLESIERFRFLREILTMVRTVLAVLGKDYN